MTEQWNTGDIVNTVSTEELFSVQDFYRGVRHVNTSCSPQTNMFSELFPDVNTLQVPYRNTPE